MTSLLLRADAGPGIGVGHLSRCVAIAEDAVARGWSVTLTGEVGGADWLTARLAELGVEVRPDWSPADIVLIDHYGDITAPDALVVSMEDGPHGRRRADIAVDANLALSARPDDGTPLVLRGPSYAPLRAAVRAARRPRRPARTPARVVVAMGGGSAGEAIAAALAALRATGLPLDVLAVSAAPVDPGGPGVEVTPPRPDLPELLADADLVVSAAGVTLLELCCLAVPAALVVIADNQLPGYTAAVTGGLAAGLGDLSVVTDPGALAADTLRDLLTDPDARAALATAAGRTVDGRGACRILNAAAGIAVRPATAADADLLLAWRNDPVTRRWSVQPDPVPADGHARWLADALVTGRILIAEQAGAPIATVRFDPIADGGYEVSLTIAPDARGRRLARPVLEAAHDTLPPGARVQARIHRDNTASRRAFTAACYHPAERPDEGPFAFYTR